MLPKQRVSEDDFELLAALPAWERNRESRAIPIRPTATRGWAPAGLEDLAPIYRKGSDKRKKVPEMAPVRESDALRSKARAMEMRSQKAGLLSDTAKLSTEEWLAKVLRNGRKPVVAPVDPLAELEDIAQRLKR